MFFVNNSLKNQFFFTRNSKNFVLGSVPTYLVSRAKPSSLATVATQVGQKCFLKWKTKLNIISLFFRRFRVFFQVCFENFHSKHTLIGLRDEIVKELKIRMRARGETGLVKRAQKSDEKIHKENFRVLNVDFWSFFDKIRSKIQNFGSKSNFFFYRNNFKNFVLGLTRTWCTSRRLIQKKTNWSINLINMYPNSNIFVENHQK